MELCQDSILMVLNWWLLLFWRLFFVQNFEQLSCSLVVLGMVESSLKTSQIILLIYHLCRKYLIINAEKISLGGAVLEVKPIYTSPWRDLRIFTQRGLIRLIIHDSASQVLMFWTCTHPKGHTNWSGFSKIAWSEARSVIFFLLRISTVLPSWPHFAA